jgi:subtilisin family serine protease
LPVVGRVRSLPAPGSCRAACLLAACLPLSALGAVPPGVLQDFAARALRSGEVRVIVRLDLEHVPAGRLPAAAEQAQRAAIAARQKRVAAGAHGSGARELHRFRHIPFMLFSADPAGIDVLGRLPDVIGFVEDLPERPSLAQSAPIIGAPAAWASGADGSGQVIAVLDTGVDTAHAFFSGPGKIVAEACFSSNVSTTVTSLCPDGVTTSLEPGAGGHCPLSVSGCDHGTHVAGIALGDDGTGPDIGIAPGAGLIPVQVFSRFDASECPGSADCAQTYPSDQIRALEQLYDWRETYPLAAVNMSLGGGFHDDQATCDDSNVVRKAAIDNLRSVGIVTIAASGNAGQRQGMMQPACISSVVSVGATTDGDDVASFSNIAAFIDLLAPGTFIRSAAAQAATVEMSGTSMATPHVAGAWAVLRQAVPQATPDQILAALRDTGTSVDDQRTGGVVTDMRRINLDLALAALQSGSPEFAATPVAGTPIDFGPVEVGTGSAAFLIEVMNTGDGTLTLACSLAGPDSDSFVMTGCPASIPPAGADQIELQCLPQTTGPLAGVLEVTTNDADEGELAYELGCEGVPALGFSHGFESSG